jgi:Protein of unknown function (DUF3617)
MRTRLILTLAGVATLSLPALAQTASLRPGQYEIAGEVTAGGGATRPTKPRTECVVEGHEQDVTRALLGGTLDPERCPAPVLKTVGTITTLTTECRPPGGQASIKIRSTVSGDSFTTTMNWDMPGMKQTIKLTGKRVGPCPR